MSQNSTTPPNTIMQLATPRLILPGRQKPRKVRLNWTQADQPEADIRIQRLSTDREHDIF
jgi:hypothetical protein